MSKRFLPGDETLCASDSPTSRFSAIFEDDGDTGYFYAFERDGAGGGHILDACHIYDVPSAVDPEVESEVAIIWTPDGSKAALLIDNCPHAIIDFERRRAYCRKNWPVPTGLWSQEAKDRLPWHESLLAPFRTNGL